MVVDLACDVALEATDGFLLGEALLDAPVDVVAGVGVIDHAGDDDLPQRGVGLAVTTAVEAMTLVLAAARVEGRRATEVGEGGFVAEPFGVVARGDEQRRGGLDAETETAEQFGGGVGDEWAEDGVELGDLVFECDGAPAPGSAG